ncbi:MAG: hypothetical protein IT179_07880 [Acidobacteria bacterium]|nr:hypothetical protein [Acidobacteriota bacterium]
MFESILSLSPAQLARQFPGENPRDIRLAALMGKSLQNAGVKSHVDPEATVPLTRNLTREIREAEAHKVSESLAQHPHLTSASSATVPVHRNIITELKGGAR